MNQSVPFSFMKYCQEERIRLGVESSLFKVSLTLLYGTFLSVGLFIAVLALIATYKFEQLHLPVNVAVANFAVAYIFTSFNTIFQVIGLWIPCTFSDRPIFCVIIESFFNLTSSTNSLIALLIAFRRFVAVTFPIWFQEHFNTAKQMAKHAAFMWLCSVLLIISDIPFVEHFHNAWISMCYSIGTKVYFTGLLYTLSPGIFYLLTFLKIKKQTEKMVAWNQVPDQDFIKAIKLTKLTCFLYVFSLALLIPVMTVGVLGSVIRLELVIGLKATIALFHTARNLFCIGGIITLSVFTVVTIPYRNAFLELLGRPPRTELAPTAQFVRTRRADAVTFSIRREREREQSCQDSM